MKLNKLALLALACLGIAGCQSSQEADQPHSDQPVKVGILQFSENPAMDQAHGGFTRALADAGYQEGENLMIDYENAAQDHSNLYGIAEKMAREDDLLLGLGTQSSQAFANIEEKKPIVFTAVTDAEGAQLVASNESPERNVTGTSNMVLPMSGVDFLVANVENLETIGILYNAGEVNSNIQYENCKAYAESLGLKVEGMTITNTNDVQGAITALAGKVDAIYLPTDNSIVQTAPTIGEVVKRMGVPTVGSDKTSLPACLATFGVDYERIGYRAGEMAVEILAGRAQPADMPVELPDHLELTVNPEMAKALDYDPGALAD
ncbi:hypothetical protein AWM75_05535 [Aerococcus urinaehominis]|uniref:ABC transporter substrate-binding protein n=1 Tax=Aerococcus urinaehominis TaxID=128944 RepID=A0A0X8FMH4_9LACT|nr:hypothetical protein AWM75_05535 [Aerococcus urinaehominis]